MCEGKTGQAYWEGRRRGERPGERRGGDRKIKYRATYWSLTLSLSHSLEFLATSQRVAFPFSSRKKEKKLASGSAIPKKTRLTASHWPSLVLVMRTEPTEGFLVREGEVHEFVERLRQLCLSPMITYLLPRATSPMRHRDQRARGGSYT